MVPENLNMTNDDGIKNSTNLKLTVTRPKAKTENKQ
jgi:hypothetical protein